jgi:hypothetical protein
MSEQLMDPALLDWIRRDEVDESEVEVEMDLEPMRTVRETDEVRELRTDCPQG